MSKKNRKLIVIALLLCLVSMIVSSTVQSNFGRVAVVEISLVTEVGTLTGYLLVPDTASAANPAPAVVTSHGYLNNREMQDINYVELARRGYVVFAMNAYAHGDSTVPAEEFSETIYVQAGGMVDAVEYLYALPFVDPQRIGVTGHSMGGGYADITMAYYTGLERDALVNGASPEQAHALNKVAAGLIVGNYPLELAELEDHSGASGYLCDLGVMAGKYDEFFAAMGSSGDLLLTSEYTTALIAVQTGVSLSGDAVESKFYENPVNGYKIALYNPVEFHAQNHFSTTAVKNLINFFEGTLGAPRPISAGNQTWWIKEAFNLVGLVGFFMFVVPFADLLLTLPFFASLRAMAFEPLPALEPGKAKRKFISTNIWSGVLDAVLILPLFLAGYLLLINRFWPQDTTGAIGLWALGCGLIALWMLRISFGKLKGRGQELGVRVQWNTFFKTLLLALMVVSGAYLLVFMADYLFQVDYRIWSFDLRIFSADKVWVALKYLPFFLVYYLVNSIAVNRSAFKNWSERKQVLVAVMFNILAPALFLTVTYAPVLFAGKTLWAMLFPGIPALVGLGALVPIIMIPFLPILGIAAYTGVKMHRLTGNAWLAALVNTILIVMLTVANTSFSFAY
jgi:hypothetical protein